MTGVSLPIRRRLLAVEADLGKRAKHRWQYGSGLLIGGRRLLTAAHVVQGAKAVTVRQMDGPSWRAELEGALIGEPDQTDLAVVDVPEAELLDAVPVAIVNRDVVGGDFVESCWAVGYPAFQEVQREDDGRSLRETAEVKGEIPPLSGLQERLLSLQVTVSPGSLPPAGALDESEWAGMSGAAVFAGELLIGVVTEHLPRRGPSDITVTPLDRLLDPAGAPPNAGEWWTRLGVPDPSSLPRVPSRPEPAYRATLRVIRQRTPVLRGRDEELSQIEAFATGARHAFGSATECSGYLWLVGGPWAGKTALLAEAVHEFSAEVDMVAYFLIAREAQASRELFLAAVVPQLAWLLHEDVPAKVDVAVFWDLWARAGARAKQLGRHLLLVVDGLDEDLRPAGVSVAGTLPSESLAEYSRVVVSSRLSPLLPDDVDVHHPLRSVRPVSLTDSPHAAELRVLAEQELRLLRRDAETSDLTFDVFGFLTAAAGPLSISDLIAMIGNVKARIVRSFVTERAARSLRSAGSQDGLRFSFAHETLLEACRADPDVGGEPEYRKRLLDWVDSWRAKGWPVSDDPAADTPRYLLDSYASTLGSEPERLATLVCDIGWLDAAVLRIGVNLVLATLREAARVTGPKSDPATMLRLLEHQARHLHSARRTGKSGQTGTQVAWQALRAGFTDIARRASDRLSAWPAPQLIPAWTTESTSAGLIREIGRHGPFVRTVAVTPDGKVVSAGGDGVVRLWDPQVDDDPGRELGRHGHDVWVVAVAVTSEGKVVSGGVDGVVRLWNPELAGDLGRELGRCDSVVGAVAVTPAGKVVSGDWDGAVRIWDPELDDDPARKLGCHDDKVLAVAVTPEGKVVSGSDDGVLRLWDPAVEGDPGRELGRHEGVAALAVTPAGEVVSGGRDGAVRIWDPAVDDDPGRELGRHWGVGALAVTPAGEVVSGGWDGVVRIWDPAVDDDSGREVGRHHKWVEALAVTPEGKVVSGSDDGVLRWWDPELAGDSGGKLERHQPAVLAVAVTPEEKVVSGGEDGVVCLWDPELAGDLGGEVGYHDDMVRAVAVTPCGKVVSAGDDGVLRLWDPPVDNDPGRELGRHDGVWAVTVTAEGKIVSGGDGVVRLWDPDVEDDPGYELGRHNGMVRAVVVTPQGKVVSGGDDGVLRVWDPAVKGDRGRELGRHDGVWAMAVTVEGKIVSGGEDGVVRLWDPEVHGDPGCELGRHDTLVRAVVVTPHGNVVSGGDDGVLRLWDPAVDGDPGRELGRDDDGVRTAAVTARGRIVVGGGAGLTLCQLTSA